MADCTVCRSVFKLRIIGASLSEPHSYVLTRLSVTIIYTREMQGIVGQASDFKLDGQLSAFFERLSQRSIELLCRRFYEEKSKKTKAIDELRCGTVLFQVA